MRKHESAEKETARIEAFSDGVFAIAITLLILEIGVPRAQVAKGPLDLANSLRHLWPAYLGYVLSFVTVGIYWANHNYIFRLYKRSDHVFLLLNVLFLMCISFLPFPTAVLSEYFTDPHNRRSAVSLYTLGLGLPAAAWLAAWLYARSHGLVDETLDPKFVATLTRMYFVTTVMYGSMVVISRFSPVAGLAVCVAVTMLYLLPPKPPVYRDDAP